MGSAFSPKKMTKISKSHFLRRSLTSQRHHLKDQGKELRLCSQLLSERNHRNFATDRPYHRFQFRKRPNSSHQNRGFIRSLSDLQDLKTDNSSDSMDGMPPLSASVELSPDDVAVSENSDSFEVFLDDFPQTIKDNVSNVISKVDGMASPHRHPENVARTLDRSNDSPSENPDSKIGRLNFSPKNLRKRWERILQKEKERYRHHNRIKSNKRRIDRAKLSTRELWDDALRRSGYYIAPKALDEEQNEEPALDILGTNSEHSEIGEMAESSHNTHLSPIFGLQVNQRQSSIDFETALPTEENEEFELPTNQIEVQRLVSGSEIDGKDSDTKNMLNDAIFESISLLIAMRPADWRKYDSSVHLSADGNAGKKNDIIFDSEIDTECDSLDDDANLDHFRDHGNNIREFLRHIMEHKYVLKTSDVNLLLAHLVTSTGDYDRDIADSCLQIFQEMKMLGNSGQYDCGPDSTTYRLLILAFSRRFQAMSEALKISQEMVERSTIDIKPELLNEALKVCRTKTELNLARSIMDSAIRKSRIKMNLASCIIYTEMLKTRKLEQEAIKVFHRINEVRSFLNFC